MRYRAPAGANNFAQITLAEAKPWEGALSVETWKEDKDKMLTFKTFDQSCEIKWLLLYFSHFHVLVATFFIGFGRKLQYNGDCCTFKQWWVCEFGKYALLHNITLSATISQYHNILHNITISSTISQYHILSPKKKQTKGKWSHHTGTKLEVKQAPS